MVMVIINVHNKYRNQQVMNELQVKRLTFLPVAPHPRSASSPELVTSAQRWGATLRASSSHTLPLVSQIILPLPSEETRISPGSLRPLPPTTLGQATLSCSDHCNSRLLL